MRPTVTNTVRAVVTIVMIRERDRAVQDCAQFVRAVVAAGGDAAAVMRTRTTTPAITPAERWTPNRDTADDDDAWAAWMTDVVEARTLRWRRM